MQVAFYTSDIATQSRDPLLSSCMLLQTVRGNKRTPKRKSGRKTLINLLTLVWFRIGNILASLPRCHCARTLCFCSRHGHMPR